MIYKYNVLRSVDKAINKARIYGSFDSSDIYIYDILNKYYNFSKHNLDFIKYVYPLRNLALELESCSDSVICNNKLKAVYNKTQNFGGRPSASNNTSTDDGINISDSTIGGSVSGENGGNNGNGSINDNTTSGSTGNSVDNINNGSVPNFAPTLEKELFILSDFTVDSTFLNISDTDPNETVDGYRLDLNDILINYTQDNIQSLIIYRDNLYNGLITRTDGDNQFFGQTLQNLIIPFNEIQNYVYSSFSESIFVHPLRVSVSSYNKNNELVMSNIATLTIDRTRGNSELSNQSATIGDGAYKADNRAVTVLNLAMFTTGLKPPYNDPEGDLIDAIRIDEISTANKGKFYYNNIEASVGQIITREELEQKLFVHKGADSSDIETDAINFSARDEGSKKWVN